MIHGMAIIAAAETAKRIGKHDALISLGQPVGRAFTVAFSRLAYIGTKAELSALAEQPHGRDWGKRKATAQASATQPVPMARRSPCRGRSRETQLTKGQPPTVECATQKAHDGFRIRVWVKPLGKPPQAEMAAASHRGLVSSALDRGDLYA